MHKSKKENTFSTCSNCPPKQYRLIKSTVSTLIYEALCSLQPAESREFRAFLQSPFFNTRPEITALGFYLLECIAGQKTPVLAEMYAYFPKDRTTPSTQLLNLANAHLLHLFERYIAVKNLAEKPLLEKNYAAQYYRKTGLDRHFKTVQRKIQNQLDKTKAGNALSLEYHYLAEWEQYQYNVAALRSGELNIQSLSKAMDAAFMAGKLRLACLALSHQAIYKTEYQIGFIPAILSALETETALAEIPALGLYYHCYQFLTVPDGEAHFQAFLRLLDETAAHFPEEELRPLYLLAINYGIRQINRSVPGSIVTTLNLYKGALHYRLLLENSQISRFAFSNIVAIALRAGETDWAEGFIEQYHPHLDRLWRDATASLCLARLEYERGQLDAAMRHLQRADYKDTMNNLTAKTLQMKIFYETNEVDALENHLKNLKNYIRRHTAIGYHRTNYSNIVRFTEQLLWLNKHDKQCVATFRENLIAEEILTEKEWLLKQLG